MRRVPALLLLACLLPLAACGDEAPSAPAKPAILVVVTSHGEIAPGEPTGLWLEEFAVPYARFRAAGLPVTVASPQGGKAPVDPRSLEGEGEPDAAALAALEDTQALGTLDLADYAAVFFPGGHGTMFDLPEHADVQAAVAYFVGGDRPAAFVCHGPAALVGATLDDGTSVLAGRKVTGFTNAEEKAVKLDEKMPFLLEDKMKALGATFAGADDWQSHVVVDGNLVTGQNPASSAATAEALLERLGVAAE